MLPLVRSAGGTERFAMTSVVLSAWLSADVSAESEFEFQSHDGLRITILLSTRHSALSTLLSTRTRNLGRNQVR